MLEPSPKRASNASGMGSCTLLPNSQKHIYSRARGVASRQLAGLPPAPATPHLVVLLQLTRKRKMAPACSAQLPGARPANCAQSSCLSSYPQLPSCWLIRESLAFLRLSFSFPVVRLDFREAHGIHTTGRMWEARGVPVKMPALESAHFCRFFLLLTSMQFDYLSGYRQGMPELLSMGWGH